MNNGSRGGTVPHAVPWPGAVLGDTDMSAPVAGRKGMLGESRGSDSSSQHHYKLRKCAWHMQVFTEHVEVSLNLN